MYQQNQYLSWSDRLPVCRHSWRRHHGSGYNSCIQQQDEEDSTVAWTHKPTMCYYTANSDLTHEYVEIEADSCLAAAAGLEEAHSGEELDDQEVWMEPSPQTDEFSENFGRSHLPTDQGMNEVSEVAADCSCPCRTVHSGWGDEATCLCMSLSPPCFNVRNTLVVGVEVDVVEELVYEDTEILETQTVFDGSLENSLIDSSSFCCNQLFHE